MKKLYVFTLTALFISGMVYSQRPSTAGKTFPLPAVSTNERVPTDTLWAGLYTTWNQPQLWTSTSGFVAGHNNYGDIKKAQQILFTGNPYNVEGAVLWFGGKIESSGDTTSKVTVHVWDLSGTGTASTGSAPAPGTSMGSVDLLISDVDTNTGFWNIVMFPAPIGVSADYAVGIDLAVTAADDTVGLITSDDGGSEFQDFSWEEWSGGGGWWTLFESGSGWGLNIDMAVFPIVDLNVPGIDEAAFTNGIRFIAYPNPASASANINYEIQNPGKVSIELRDLSGKQVLFFSEGEKTAGSHNVNLDLSNVADGTYLVAVSVNNKLVIQKLTVSK